MCLIDEASGNICPSSSLRVAVTCLQPMAIDSSNKLCFALTAAKQHAMPHGIWYCRSIASVLGSQQQQTCTLCPLIHPCLYTFFDIMCLYRWCHGYVRKSLHDPGLIHIIEPAHVKTGFLCHRKTKTGVSQHHHHHKGSCCAVVFVY